MDSPDPTTLHVKRAVSGESESLEWIVRRFSPLLLAQARYRVERHLQGVHEPEDLVQRTWLVALDRLDRIEPKGGRLTPVLLRYLSSTLLQTYRNLRRAAASRPAPAAGAMNDSRSLSAPDPVREATGVVSRALRSETRDAVSDAIDEMSGKDREILVLRGIEEMSYAVIAIKLDVSEGALKVRYHRALRRLRGHLPEDLVAAMEDA